MARTTPISPRPVESNQRPLVHLMCITNAYHAKDKTVKAWWHHLDHIWTYRKISDSEAFAAIAAGPGDWSDAIKEAYSPYNPLKGEILSCPLS